MLGDPAKAVVGRYVRSTVRTGPGLGPTGPGPGPTGPGPPRPQMSSIVCDILPNIKRNGN